MNDGHLKTNANKVSQEIVVKHSVSNGFRTCLLLSRAVITPILLSKSLPNVD